MSSAQKTQFIAMVAAVTLALAGLIFMTKQIDSSPGDQNSAAAEPAEITPKASFVSNCEEGMLGTVDCNCLVTRLEAAGYNSDERWRALATAISNAAAAPQTVALPADYQGAFNSCRS